MSAMHLRHVDRFARAILAQQPVAQRTFHWFDLLGMQINWMYLFTLILFIMGAIYVYPMVLEQLQTGQGFTRQQGGVFLAPVAIVSIAVWGLLLPFLKWCKALSRGRVAVAHIQSIQVKERGEQGIYDARIAWIVYGVGEPFRAEYKETTETRQVWIIQAKVGDQIVVLVDPVKPKVLEAVGPVDAEPRVPVPEIPLAVERSAE